MHQIIFAEAWALQVLILCAAVGGSCLTALILIFYDHWKGD
ncbi:MULTISPECIES: hypothetical protein [Clostridiaceae]|nr:MULTISPECIES: hypothetical protein [Clostridiaceae]